MTRKLRTTVLGSLLVTFAAVGCSKQADNPPGLPARAVADAIHAVIEADRTVYAKNVVNRLQDDRKIIKATEHWEDENTLPLPGQMLRMGAEHVQKKNIGVSYALLSQWPVNKKNAPQTGAEKAGLKAVAANPKQSFYQEETLGGRRYMTAVYADTAVAAACVNCHNEHKDSPRRDFKQGDVLGGVVIRIALDAAPK
jgi:hypothetical protein